MATDFRSWLQGKDKYALEYTGNDGRIDWDKVNSRGADTAVRSYMPGQAGTIQNYITGLYDQFRTDSENKFRNDMMSQLRAAASYRPPTPRIAKFDVMANWRNAQSAAERAVNPLYEQKLNNFLAQVAAKRAGKQQEFNLTKEGIDTEKANTLQDNALTRTRTEQDVTAAIDKVNQTEGYFQEDEGAQFDKDYQATAQAIAAEGGQNTGLGKQSISDMIRLRNVTSQRQLDEFKGQREAKMLFKTRTFEDLAIGDERADQLATSKTKAAQFDLDRYIEDLGFEEQEFRFSTEADRLRDVLTKTQEIDTSGARQFLAGLAGQGYSAADIAATRNVYGI